MNYNTDNGKGLSVSGRIRAFAGSLALALLFAGLVPAMSLTTSCTQNKGHIGPWFGYWWLDEILIDGYADPNYHCDTYFAFMADNVMVFQATGPENHTIERSCIGMWRHKDAVLTFNFDNHDDNSGQYSTPYWIYMSEPRIYTLAIDKYGSKRMRWSWVTDDGRHITYVLTKTL